MERTKDAEKIRAILTHEAILPNISSDNNPNFELPLTDEYHYLLDEGALFILHPDGEDWEIHANVIPEYRGGAFDLCQEAFQGL